MSNQAPVDQVLVGEVQVEAEEASQTTDSIKSQNAVQPKFWVQFWNSGALWLFPQLFFLVFGLGIIGPHLPILAVNYFASSNAGQPIQCESYDHNSLPMSCKNSYATVVLWSSWVTFAGEAVSFFTSPILGKLSDQYGRKPIIIFGQTLFLFSPIVIYFNIKFGFPYIWNYFGSFLFTVFSIFAAESAYIADVIHKDFRTQAYGLLIGSFSLGLIAAAPIGGMLSTEKASIAYLLLSVISLLYFILFVRESLSKDDMQKAKAQAVLEAQQQSSDQQKNTLYGVTKRHMVSTVVQLKTILLGKKLVFRLSLICIVTYAVSMGIFDFISSYLQLIYNYGPLDYSIANIVNGVCALVGMFVFFHFLNSYLAEKWLLVIGLALQIVEMSVLSFTKSKLISFMGRGLGAMAFINGPIITGIVSKMFESHEQGLVQGALASAKSVGIAVGPVVLAAVFSLFTQYTPKVPFFPQAPFLLSIAVILIAIGLIIDLNMPKDLASGGQRSNQSCDLESTKSLKQDIENNLVDDWQPRGSQEDDPLLQSFIPRRDEQHQ